MGASRGSRPGGFTLLEVIVVLAVVALGAVVVVPRVGAVRGVVVDVEARRLADAVAFGRERAILSGTTMRLVLDAEGRSWRVGRIGRDAGTVTDAEGTTLAGDVRIRSVSVGGVPARGDGVVVLDLQPDGDALTVRIALADGRGRAATVVLPPAGRRPLVTTGGAS
jgi:type II secretion system protein H